ncbi:hypothetical protein, partial [Neisseria sp. HMSC077D05]|uniref:hypothetical protein n=1 Tax=Neisseria sp. HMSC077D05 TaxID=1715079 RepID=UPI0009F32B62
NTQPPEGGWSRLIYQAAFLKRFNTQPPEGGWVSTHSRPKAAGRIISTDTPLYMFQHTAARRRLGRPAAKCDARKSFNTQPPEGGWPPEP